MEWFKPYTFDNSCVLSFKMKIYTNRSLRLDLKGSQIISLLFPSIANVTIDKLWKILEFSTLREKCPNTGNFLVCIFPHLDWIHRDTSYHSGISKDSSNFLNTIWLSSLLLLWLCLSHNIWDWSIKKQCIVFLIILKCFKCIVASVRNIVFMKDCLSISIVLELYNSWTQTN